MIAIAVAFGENRKRRRRPFSGGSSNGRWRGPFKTMKVVSRPRTHSTESRLNGHRNIKGGMVRSAGFEPTTTAFGGRYSIQLSYERMVADAVA
jgi:hypothetical protein